MIKLYFDYINSNQFKEYNLDKFQLDSSVFESKRFFLQTYNSFFSFEIEKFFRSIFVVFFFQNENNLNDNYS